MKKYLLLLINLISAIIVVFTIGIIQIKYPNKDIFNYFDASSSYAKSQEFSQQVSNHIKDIFKYISYKEAFENNELFDYNKIIATSKDINGNLKKWSIIDCIDISVNHNYYIDTNFNVMKMDPTITKDYDRSKIYDFISKTYPSKKTQGISTEEEFITEVMQSISDYFKCYDTLNVKHSNLDYVITFYDNNTPVSRYNNANIDIDTFYDNNAYAYISSKEGKVTSNINYFDNNLLNYAIKNNPHTNKSFVLYCTINTNFPNNDIFKESFIAYNKNIKFCFILNITFIITTLIFIITFILLLRCIFSTQIQVESSTMILYTLPTEFYIILYIIINSFLFLFINRHKDVHLYILNDITQIKVYLYILTIYCSSMVLFCVFSSKYANGTLLPTIIKKVEETQSQQILSAPPTALYFILLIQIIILIIIAFFLMYLYSLTNNIYLIICGVIIIVASVVFFVYTLTLRSSFKRSIEEQMKANDMRTSLITNVSHDIKTPLTSILNYASLITNEISKPSESYQKNLKHYSTVIIEKSNRLKDLINDIIFDSKLSSGTINLEMKKIDLISFTKQVFSEFNDKFKSKKLKTIFEYSIKNAFINADEKQLYRVFQNLLSNIDKYALENSRIYVDILDKKKLIVITIKNIQKEKLEVPIDTIKEKFVRGSKSRSTEGFGLGLSITENLVRLMNGKFQISNIRDEFITTLTFIKYDE